MRTMLLLANPDTYVDFCKRHPVNMCDHLAQETRNRGAGDIMPPTPAADAFFQLFHLKNGELPTQSEYAEYCFSLPKWAEWIRSYPYRVQQCFRAKLYRNFYPSFVDSLHVWALLGTRYYTNGKLVFDRCMIDTKADVVAKTDLLVYRGPQVIRIALCVNTKASRRAIEIKRGRGYTHPDTITLLLDVNTKRDSTGKHWYHWPNDFQPIFLKAEQLHLPLRDKEYPHA